MPLKPKPLPSAARLHHLLDYNPITGEFRWNQSKGRSPAGSIAGTIMSNGYRAIKADELYLAHRIAWKMTYVEDPVGEIDHINNDRLDNRIDNLREASCNEQKWNTTVSKNNRLALKGVSQDAAGFRAEITVNGKRFRSKRYATPEKAYDVACKYREKHHKGFANHG